MKQFESIDDVYVYYADKIRNAQTEQHPIC